MGLLSSFLKIILIVVNSILFLIGALIFTFAAILLWGNDILGDIKDIEFIDFTSLKVVSIILLVIGACIIILSIIGLIGNDFIYYSLLNNIFFKFLQNSQAPVLAIDSFWWFMK